MDEPFVARGGIPDQQTRMTLDQAIRWLRADPASADIVRDTYLGRDVVSEAKRFLRSAEFLEVKRLLGSALDGATVADIGAGTGIAAYALIVSGARVVFAVEPDDSDEVGRGAIERLRQETALPIETVGGTGEDLPLPDAAMDIVYVRQVLHHVADLDRFMAEVDRVLRPGGILIACREHVVDNDRQKALFLRSHPVHRLAGGENAYSLDEYVGAITGAGLQLDSLLAPWDSVVNAYPVVRSAEELDDYPGHRLEQLFGRIGRAASRLPGVKRLAWWHIRRPLPGRMYSFLCSKRPYS